MLTQPNGKSWKHQALEGPYRYVGEYVGPAQGEGQGGAIASLSRGRAWLEEAPFSRRDVKRVTRFEVPELQAQLTTAAPHPTLKTFKKGRQNCHLARPRGP